MDQRWRDSVWLVFLGLQALAIIFVDAVVFYPVWLYKHADTSPLYFLQRLKDYYVATYNDPLVQAATEPNWMPFMLLVEVGLQLPTALYATYWLSSSKKGTNGPLELLLLVHAFETAFSTAVCVNDIFYWDDGVYSWEAKKVFIFQIYGPFLVIPSLMFIDMYWRLYSRVSAPTPGTKKVQ